MGIGRRGGVGEMGKALGIERRGGDLEEEVEGRRDGEEGC